jgi:hypothetical protein
MYEKVDTVIAMGSLKQASLYSNYIVPINIHIDYAWAIVDNRTIDVNGNILEFEQYMESIINTGMFESMTHPEFRKNTKYFQRLIDVNEAGFDVARYGVSVASKLPIGMTEQNAFEAAAKYTFQLQSLIDDFGLRSVPMDFEGHWLDENEGPLDSSVFQIAGLNLIDTRGCEWSQILEFRKNAEAVATLRNLRKFLTDEHGDSSRARLEDDVLSRIDKYDQTVKEWAFKTKTGAIGTVLSSKMLATASGASFFASMLGSSAQAIAGMSVALSVELGQIWLEVKKEKFALQASLRENPIRYIKYANDSLALMRD